MTLWGHLQEAPELVLSACILSSHRLLVPSVR